MTKRSKLNISFRLPVLLWLIFLVAVFTEVWVLYNYLYLGVYRRQDILVVESAPTTKINLQNYDQVIEWLNARQNFQLPVYELRSGSSGRENPFAEYR